MKKEKRQKMCLEIIDQFEQLLEEKDISIPCEDSAEEKERHDGGNNARIYGAEYWRLTFFTACKISPKIFRF